MALFRPGLAALIIIALALPCLAEDDGLHGQEWAFGHSETRNETIWKNGVDGGLLHKRARPQISPEKGADTSGGIDRALEEAEKKGVKGSVGMSMGQQSSAWRSGPAQPGAHPDENLYRNRRSVVRAFADVKAGDDLNISVGPELILKNDANTNETAQENQPDASLGIGMKFKYDF